MRKGERVLELRGAGESCWSAGAELGAIERERKTRIFCHLKSFF